MKKLALFIAGGLLGCNAFADEFVRFNAYGGKEIDKVTIVEKPSDNSVYVATIWDVRKFLSVLASGSMSIPDIEHAAPYERIGNEIAIQLEFKKESCRGSFQIPKKRTVLIDCHAYGNQNNSIVVNVLKARTLTTIGSFLVDSAVLETSLVNEISADGHTSNSIHTTFALRARGFRDNPVFEKFHIVGLSYFQ